MSSLSEVLMLSSIYGLLHLALKTSVPGLRVSYCLAIRLALFREFHVAADKDANIRVFVPGQENRSNIIRITSMSGREGGGKTQSGRSLDW